MIPTTQADYSILKHLKSKTLQQPVRVLSHQSYQSASIIYWKVFFQKPLRLFRILALLHRKRPQNSSSNYFLPLFQNGEPISNVACTMWLSSIYFNSIECVDFESRTSNLLRLLHSENPFVLLSKPPRSKPSHLLQMVKLHFALHVAIHCVQSRFFTTHNKTIDKDSLEKHAQLFSHHCGSGDSL
ncbi:uncharacterized protein LOC105791297 isoform X2 [Gossypium raimondii]|uniref:uncharacterized protein LOC105791297 isoform X2 n=1 Tax=Gossypium raimondii TaxID=29730 RepID=UPI00063A9E8A|nr:uncharacterized protein LOC105791297 isoform X2 [Gossypium raimondii]